jgi:serine/threonine protein phosphatase PrpC
MTNETHDHPVPPPPARPATPETDGVVPLTPPDPVAEQEPEPEAEPFADGPPPLPQPMLVLDGELPDHPETPVPEVDHGTCRCGGKFDADGWCTECGERKPDPRHHFSAQPVPEVAAVCDRGIRHTANEDAMAVWADTSADGAGLRAALVVCDGVSSASRSAEASLAAAYAGLETLATSDEPVAERLVRATDAAAEAVGKVGEEFPDAAPSCTFVASVLEGGSATVGSVGDSRAYWLPDDGEPRRLTRDDSMAEEQIDTGVDRATAEAGPLGHTITRWLGPDSPDHRPQIATVDVGAPGWLLLCSDGLWNYASEAHDLAAVVRAEQGRVGRDPLALAQALVDWANGRGGVDNITVALARTGPFGVAHDASDTAYPQAEQADESDPTDPGEDGTHG